MYDTGIVIAGKIGAIAISRVVSW